MGNCPTGSSEITPTAPKMNVLRLHYVSPPYTGNRNTFEQQYRYDLLVELLMEREFNKSNKQISKYEINIEHDEQKTPSFERVESVNDFERVEHANNVAFYSIPDIKPNQNYRIRVRASIGNKVGVWSSWMNVNVIERVHTDRGTDVPRRYWKA
eukprot:376766_1